MLEALFAADGPVPATLARTLSLDESSVYRNLELLEQRGIARHLHLGHSPGLYALAGRARSRVSLLRTVRERHCRLAGTPRADPRADPERVRIHARFTHFAIVGVCPDCCERSWLADSSAERSRAGAPRLERSERAKRRARSVPRRPAHG